MRSCILVFKSATIVMMLIAYSPCSANELFWTDLTSPGFISRTDTNNLVPTDILADLGYQPGALAIIKSPGWMFWTGAGNTLGTIYRADLDGTGIQVIGETDRYLRDLAVDPIGEKLYWTRTVIPDRQAVIERSNLDFSEREVVLTIDEGSIGSLSLDPFGQKVFWSTGQIANPPIRNIRSANFDGTEVEVIASGLRYSDVEVDPVGGKVYWTTVDTGDRRIQRANLDGTQLEDILPDTADYSSFPGYTHLPSDLAIDLDDHKLYWLNNQFRDDRIMRSDLDGANVEQVYAGHGRSGLRDLEFPRVVPEPTSLLLSVSGAIWASMALPFRKTHRC